MDICRRLFSKTSPGSCVCRRAGSSVSPLFITCSACLPRLLIPLPCASERLVTRRVRRNSRGSRNRTAAGKVAPKQMDGFVRLIEQKYFVVDRYDVAGAGEVVVPIAAAGCLVGLSGR